MSGTNLSLTQKQNEYVKREPYYRKYGLCSFLGGFLIFMTAGLSFTKGNEVLAFGLLLVSLFSFALATDSLFKLFEIESIRGNATKHN